jgi:hypothetical protein
VKWNKQMDDLCFLSKNLYNYCNYLIRQEFINNHKILGEYKLDKQLAKESIKKHEQYLGKRVHRGLLNLYLIEGLRITQ